jgi:hypothetical protein
VAWIAVAAAEGDDPEVAMAAIPAPASRATTPTAIRVSG